ncbi:hypothetical protein Tco_1378723 [Tanacetum coccineum]
MIGKINLLWKTVYEKLNDASPLENAGSSMTPRSIAAISHDEKEELRKKGVKSPSNYSPQKEDSPSTNKCNLDLDDMKNGNNKLQEKGREEDDTEDDMKARDKKEEKGSEFKTEEEVKEVFENEEEEEDEEEKDFSLPPTMKELTHHEWLLKHPRPPWVKSKIRADAPDNIKISCMIGHIFNKYVYIDPESPVNIMSRNLYNKIMTYGLKPRQNPSKPDKICNFVERVKRIKIFIGSLAYECDFMILEDTSSVIDPRLGEMVLGKPFIEGTGLTHNNDNGAVIFEQSNGRITFKLPYTMETFKHMRLLGFNTDSIPPSAHEENFGHKETHYYQSLLIGEEYKQDKGDKKGIRYLMRLEKEMMEHKGEVT